MRVMLTTCKAGDRWQPGQRCPLKVDGLAGRIRGMQFSRPDGKTVRPSLIAMDGQNTRVGRANYGWASCAGMAKLARISGVIGEVSKRWNPPQDGCPPPKNARRRLEDTGAARYRKRPSEKDLLSYREDAAKVKLMKMKPSRLPSLSSVAGKPTIEGEIKSDGPLAGVPFEVWDISETISKLAYLTHNHFRYYGKFPSTLAAGFLNRFGKPRDRVIDNYCGSGTTLVEAALRGMPCVGIDINPFAMLAAKVKTRRYDADTVKFTANKLIAHIMSSSGSACEDHQLNLFPDPRQVALDAPIPTDPAIDKWFARDVQRELSIIRSAILGVSDEWHRLFFLCAFFAIIRRVSVAYDGEVRPHVNPKKKPRSAISAFAKKVGEMLERSKLMSELIAENGDGAVSVLQGDNRRLDELVPRKPCFDLALSHPPYLNCFDYLPVYRLEFIWADIVPDVSHGGDYSYLRKQEIRAWPAKTEEARELYFANQKIIYSQLRKVLRKGATAGVVIGDATLNKKLIRVHEAFADLLTQVGFKIDRIVYRTTHYGTGKYSYDHRADYHQGDDTAYWSRLDEDQGKRDAIIVAKAC